MQLPTTLSLYSHSLGVFINALIVILIRTNSKIKILRTMKKPTPYALLKQIENYNIEPNRPIHSIFFGGGTPSLFQS
jgi:hypothetical protein